MNLWCFDASCHCGNTNKDMTDSIPLFRKMAKENISMVMYALYNILVVYIYSMK
jgi:hypothetical protein